MSLEFNLNVPLSFCITSTAGTVSGQDKVLFQKYADMIADLVQLNNRFVLHTYF